MRARAARCAKDDRTEYSEALSAASPAPMSRAAFASMLIAFIAGWAAISIFRQQQVAASPFSLRSGARKELVFTASANALYSLELRCRRTLPFDQLEHDLGSEGLMEVKVVSDGGAVPVDLHHVSVAGPPATLPAEAYRTAANGQTINGLIGTFRGEPGKRYVITVTALKDQTNLDVTNPTLVVLNVSNVEARAVVLWSCEAVALVCCIVAGVIWWYSRPHRAKYSSRNWIAGSRREAP